jgi:predicted transposase YbfD/YdcC
MQKILLNLQIIDNYDPRQQGKIKYKLSEIIALSFIAMAANANDCVDIANFAQEHKPQLKTLLPLKNGVPAHDTIYRTFTIISPEYLQDLQTQFNQQLNSGEGETIRKIFHLDGKTQRGTNNADQKPNHIVSAIDEDGFSLEQELVDDKSNEITALPKLIDKLNVSGHIVTIDAAGTQKNIVQKLRRKRADYVLALRGNQGRLCEEVELCFDDPNFLGRCEYYQTLERARVEWSCVSIGI